MRGTDPEYDWYTDGDSDGVVCEYGGTSTPPPPPSEPPSTGTDPRFTYCYQAKEAGYGPYYRGTDPEYDWYRDADSDGIVCE